jgi:glyoxylase-like metal-dependent hydrolase (beta-lactamase superfamily II)
MTLHFTQLTPGLWVAQSRSMHLNTGVFLSRDEAVLVDPALYPEELEDIHRFLDEHGATPMTIVLTHWHWDHILGPAHFPGVRVLAHEGYVPWVREHAADIVKPIADWESKTGVLRESPFVVPMPHVTVGSDSELLVGDISLQLVHVPGHSHDQLALYDPSTRALWASDILSDLEIPLVSDSLAAYERTLAMLLGVDIRALVPGHGEPTTDPAEARRRLDEDQAYLAEVRARVESALAGGLDMDAAVLACEDVPYRNREYNEDSHRLNVESIYMELGGEGDPAKRGWSQDFFA